MSTYDSHEFQKEVSEIIQNPADIAATLEKPPVQRVEDVAEELVKGDPNYLKIAIIVITSILAVLTPVLTVYFTQ